MRFKVKIDGREHEVHASELDSQARSRVEIDGKSYRLKVAPLSHHRLNVQVDGRTLGCAVARVQDGAWVWIGGRTRFVVGAGEILEEAETEGGALDAGAPKPRGVKAPTAASVVRILVEVGQTVEKGQELAVVSAMKMEQTLLSPTAGVVRNVHCKAGDVVAPGRAMIEIVPVPERPIDPGHV